jgi:hypothetical protein
MNLYYTLLSLLLSSLVAAESLPFFGGSQRVLDDGVQIPGESPLEHCQPNIDDDILRIDHINLTPNPPVPCVLPSALLSLLSPNVVVDLIL